jgi:hypothetical protein
MSRQSALALCAALAANAFVDGDGGLVERNDIAASDVITVNNNKGGSLQQRPSTVRNLSRAA